MDNLARKTAEQHGEALCRHDVPGRRDVLGSQGTVVRKEGRELGVAVGDLELVARRAAGCLLDPAVGDTVLVGSSSHEHWVLTVLEHDASLSSEISVDGDLRLRTAHGKVAIVAQDGIELISPGTTSVVSNQVEVRARTVNALVEGVELVGGWMRTEIDKVKLFARSLDQVVDRFSQRSKRSYREVTDFDQLKAGSAHHRIDKTMRTHAGDVAITADGIVKMDGKQIHVG